MSAEPKPTRQSATFSHANFMDEVVATAGVPVEQLTNRQDAPIEMQTDLMSIAKTAKKIERHEKYDPAFESLNLLAEADALPEGATYGAALVEAKLGRYEQAEQRAKDSAGGVYKEIGIARIDAGEDPASVIGDIGAKIQQAKEAESKGQYADINSILLHAAQRGDAYSISRIESGDLDETTTPHFYQEQLLISQGRYVEAREIERQREHGSIKSVERDIIVHRLQQGDQTALEDVLRSSGESDPHCERDARVFSAFVALFESIARQNPVAAMPLLKKIEEHSDQYGLVTAVRGTMAAVCARHHMIDEADELQQKFLEADAGWDGHRWKGFDPRGHLSLVMKLGVARQDPGLLEWAEAKLTAAKELRHDSFYFYRLGLYPKLATAYLEIGDEAAAWAVADSLTDERGYKWAERTATLTTMARYFVDHGRLSDAKRVPASIPLGEPGGVGINKFVTTTYRRKEVLLAIADALADQAKASQT